MVAVAQAMGWLEKSTQRLTQHSLAGTGAELGNMVLIFSFIFLYTLIFLTIKTCNKPIVCGENVQI